MAASRESHDWLFDPTPSVKSGTLAFAQDAPLATAFRLPAAQPDVTDAPLMASLRQEHAQPLPLPPARAVIETVQAVPLPVPRPADLRTSEGAALPQMAVRSVSRRSQTAALPSAPVDNRSFFEKLLGVPPQASGQALGYAALESGGAQPGTRLSPAAVAGAAIYDISARLVYMPSGERLEAHSGLGDKLDDPRFVHVRMRGATPPGIYNLTEREQLFHGVRAIRLDPVNGSGTVHGRTGLLAHTYMLGPNGDSNGCVSFKHYDKFLQAFLKGEVKRLVVVTGRGQDRPPSIADSRIGTPERTSSRTNET